MHKSLKAALLSGLVFPGLGQLYLGQKRRGVLIFLSALLVLIFIIFHMTSLIYREIAVTVAKGEAVDVVAVEKAMGVEGGSTIRVGSLLLLVLWGISIFLALKASPQGSCGE